MVRFAGCLAAAVTAFPLSILAADPLRESWDSAVAISRAAEAKARKCEAGIMTSQLEDCADLWAYTAPGGRFRELAKVREAFSAEWIARNGEQAEHAAMAERIRYTSITLRTYVEMLPTKQSGN